MSECGDGDVRGARELRVLGLWQGRGRGTSAHVSMCVWGLVGGVSWYRASWCSQAPGSSSWSIDPCHPLCPPNLVPLLCALLGSAPVALWQCPLTPTWVLSSLPQRPLFPPAGLQALFCPGLFHCLTTPQTHILLCGLSTTPTSTNLQIGARNCEIFPSSSWLSFHLSTPACLGFQPGEDTVGP